MAAELTWRKAIEKVLSEAPGAMHYQDITKKIIQNGLRSNLGATPASSVASVATVAVKEQGEKCPFQKIGMGLFVWKAKAGITQQPSMPAEEPEQEDEVQYDIISSFGMFWRRDAIEWVSTPRILGMQEIRAQAVDFHKQLGIYLLYDGREVIYVGRATERP